MSGFPQDRVPARVPQGRTPRAVFARRSWLKRILPALPGVALIASDFDVRSTTGRLLHDLGLPFLILALTLPAWRRRRARGVVEYFEAENAMERVGGTLTRAAAWFLMLAAFGLIGHRVFQLAGSPAGERASTVVGVVAIILAPIALLCGRIVPRIGPRQTRRTERAVELARALNGGWVRKSRLLALGPALGFDPDAGATGRPAPIESYPGGPRRPVRFLLRLHLRWGGTCTLHWSGKALTLGGGPLKYTYKVALAEPSDAIPAAYRSAGPSDAVDRPAPRGHVLDGELAELVWCETRFHRRYPQGSRPTYTARRRVYLLDSAGYAFASIGGVRDGAKGLKTLAQHAGVPFHAYSISARGEAERKIDHLMFPRRRNSLDVG